MKDSAFVTCPGCGGLMPHRTMKCLRCGYERPARRFGLQPAWEEWGEVIAAVVIVALTFIVAFLVALL